jgi:hypothetical protein
LSDEAHASWEELAAVVEEARARRLRRICFSLEVDELVGALIVELIERVELLERGRR